MRAPLALDGDLILDNFRVEIWLKAVLTVDTTCHPVQGSRVYYADTLVGSEGKCP